MEMLSYQTMKDLFITFIYLYNQMQYSMDIETAFIK